MTTTRELWFWSSVEWPIGQVTYLQLSIIDWLTSSVSILLHLLLEALKSCSLSFRMLATQSHGLQCSPSNYIVIPLGKAAFNRFAWDENIKASSKCCYLYYCWQLQFVEAAENAELKIVSSRVHSLWLVKRSAYSADPDLALWRAQYFQATLIGLLLLIHR